MKTFKFRLNPTRQQRTLLSNTLELCRWVYNETLATRKNAWEQEKKSLSWYDTIKLLPVWKKEKPELVRSIPRFCRKSGTGRSGFQGVLSSGEGRRETWLSPLSGYGLVR